MSNRTHRNLRDIDPQALRDYRNGWNCSARCGSLEAADARGVSNAWYLGYSDNATGHQKYHRLLCDNMKGHDYCPDIEVK